jgi:cytochrome c
MKRAMLFFGLTVLGGYCQAIEMPKDAVEIGCPNCHAIDHKVVGPAWVEVSRRYRDKRDDQAFLDQLVKKVSTGGQGNWGNLPMTPNDPLGKKHDKIVELVKFVLTLSDQMPQNISKQ